MADARVSWPANLPDETQPYAGAVLRRCILWQPSPRPYFLDLVLVRAPGPAPRRIELAWHHIGALELPGLAPTTLSGATGAYAHLDEIAELRERQGRGWRALWRGEGAGTACWALDPPGATVLAAAAPYNPAAERMSLLLRQVAATEAAFATIFEPFAAREGPAIRAVHWHSTDTSPAGVLSLVVEGEGWRHAWLVSERGGARGDDGGPFGDAIVHEYVLE